MSELFDVTKLTQCLYPSSKFRICVLSDRAYGVKYVVLQIVVKNKLAFLKLSNIEQIKV